MGVEKGFRSGRFTVIPRMTWSLVQDDRVACYNISILHEFDLTALHDND